MTPKSEKFLTSITKDYILNVNAKYRKGDAEHTGDLLDLSIEELVHHAEQENIDQYTYMKAIGRKWEVVKKFLIQKNLMLELAIFEKNYDEY